jgi:hypothetical protein
MQTKTIATLVVTSALFTVSACKWFKQKPANDPINVIGKWKIDSVYDASTNHQSLLAFFKPTASKDSSNYLEFTADSIALQTFSKDSVRYSIHDSLLVIQDKKELDFFIVKKENDSTLHLTTTDSTVMILKKQ